MIRINLPMIIVVYLVVLLAVLFALWLGGDWKRKRRERRDRKFRLVCNICGVTYEDRTRNPIPACPKCGSLNERAQLRDI